MISFVLALKLPKVKKYEQYGFINFGYYYFIALPVINLTHNQIPLINVMAMLRLLTFKNARINQLLMYISELFPKENNSTAGLLTSIIEPDDRNYSGKFITKKIPLADKTLISEYKQREKRYHYNTPSIKLSQTSNFYLTVHLQKTVGLHPKNFLSFPFHKRAKILSEILKEVSYLVKTYGYFYITHQMVSFGNQGQAIVWINEDYFSNKPQFKISHGRFSEDFFVADFKDNFGGNFIEIRQFRRAKNIESLLKILDKGEYIYSSTFMSEPISKDSLIYRNDLLRFSTINQSAQNLFDKFDRKALRHAESSHNIMMNLNSESYHGQQENANEEDRRLMRTLSSPNQVLGGNSNVLSNYGKLTYQNFPKINFIYTNKEAWKKKEGKTTQKEDLIKSLKLRQYGNKSESLNVEQKQYLKVSFPYTTTHSFCPIASFGSINLSSEQAVRGETAQTSLKEILLRPEGRKQQKMESIDLMQAQFENLFGVNGDDYQEQMQIAEMELELENLFSCGQAEERQEQDLEVIREEFQNIFQN